jgi:mono/diheme cytochrome c family protein
VIDTSSGLFMFSTLRFGNHGQGSALARAVRTASTSFLVFLIVGSSAWGQATGATDDVGKGQHLAIMLCTSCHVVAPDQPYAPTLSPPAPSFASIAQRQGIDMASLRGFLTSTRQGLENPNGMPNPHLADFQIKEIGAYILSLKK